MTSTASAVCLLKGCSLLHEFGLSMQLCGGEGCSSKNFLATPFKMGKGLHTCSAKRRVHFNPAQSPKRGRGSVGQMN